MSRATDFIASVIAGALVCGVSCAEAAQIIPPERELARPYRVDTWTSDDGLPQNTVLCLRQTRDGYLWIGTISGLVRFDGIHFKVFDRELSTAKSSNVRCLQLVEDSAGALWIRTPDALVCYQDGAFQHYDAQDSRWGAPIWTVCARREGGLWIGTSKGLKIFRDGACVPVRGAHDRMDHLYEDLDGWLWTVSDGWMERIPAREDGTSSSAFPFSRAFKQASGLSHGKENSLWIGARDGLWRWDGQTLQNYSRAAGLLAEAIGWLVPDKPNCLWVKNSSPGPPGFYYFQNGRFTRREDIERLAGGDIRCLYKDREDNTWIGTGASGLIRLQPRRIPVYTNEDGLVNDSVSWAAPGVDGSIWICTGKDVSRFTNGGWTSYEIMKTRPDWLGVDIGGSVWVTYPKGGLHLLRGSRFEKAPIPEVGSHYIPFKDRSEHVCLYSDERVFRWDENRWTFQMALPGPSPKDVLGILEGPAGVFWFGTKQQGVVRLRDGRMTRWTTSERLLSNETGPLLVENDGTAWIGSSLGLNRIKRDKVSSITAVHGLPDNAIYSMIEDTQGQYWMNGNRGVYRVSKRDLHTVADGRTNRLNCVAYGSADGLLSNEANGPGCQDRQGRFWFPTTHGVAVFDPKELSSRALTPPVVIEKVVANGEITFEDGLIRSNLTANASRWLGRPLTPGIFAGPAISLPPASRQSLEIHFTANIFTAPEKARFQYRLEGHEAAWQEVSGPDRVTRYTNLRPGPYTFRVLASNHQGVWNEKERQLAFYLAPYFHETKPFYALCILGILGAAAAVQAWRLRWQGRVLRLEHQLALDEERARIGRDIHDDLGSRLSQLSILQELVQRNSESPAEAQPHLEKLRTTTTETFQALDEIVWAVNPRQDSLAGLISHLRRFVPEFLAPAGVQVRLDFPQPAPECPLSAEARHDLFLILKEALNNVVKHSRASEVWLRLRIENAQLEITVEDNGAGLKDAGKKDRIGNGLGNMEKRAAALGGSFKITERAGGGTLVRITVPAGTGSK